jgi:hypothetical protein
MLFNIIPTITNTNGMATTNRGFIDFSLKGSTTAFGLWKRKGVRTRETSV